MKAGIYGWAGFSDDQDNANDYLDKRNDDGIFQTAEISQFFMGGFNKLVF